MDELEALRRYAERSAPPARLHVDVADDVLATLRGRETVVPFRGASLRPLIAAAAASVVVAATVGYAASASLAAMTDPLGSLFAPVVVTLQ